MRPLLILLAASLHAQTWTLKERFGVPYAPQPVTLARTGAALSPTGFVMTGPEGVEVPWQPLSNGSVMIHTGLPAARRTWFWKADATAATDYVRIITGLDEVQPVPGDVVIFAVTAPGGTTVGAPYYIKDVQSNTIDYRLSTLADLSDTVDITGGVSQVALYRPGFIASGSDLYARGHGYATGNPIRVSSSGTLPAGLAAATTYYVINVDANRFRLATSRANALAGTAIATSGGSGYHETSIEWTWTLSAGTPSATHANPVTLTSGTNHEMTNGLTGVRVVSTGGNGSPHQLAAIQGVRLSDGTWAATGPNRIYNNGTSTLFSTFTGYTATVLESGPLMTQIRATHTLTRPVADYGAIYVASFNATDSTITLNAPGASFMAQGQTSVVFTPDGGATMPAGLTAGVLYWLVEPVFDSVTNNLTAKLSTTRGGSAIAFTTNGAGTIRLKETMALAGAGEFVETITLFAGQKYVLVETQADAQLQYFLNLRSAGVFEPDRARWRGHYASALACGRKLSDGTVNGVNGAFYQDSLFDLPAEGVPFYQCGTGFIKYAPNWNLGSSGVDSGYYWLMFGSGATGAAPIAGYFIGRAARSEASFAVGPGLYTSANHFSTSSAAVGITMFAGFRSPSGQDASRVRREWAIYTGRVDEMPASGLAIQPVALQKNGIANSETLTALAARVMEFGDPAGGWPAPFADDAVYDAIANEVATNSTYRSQFLADAPELTSLVDLWTGGATAVEYLVSLAEQRTHNWAYKMAQKDSTHNIQWFGYAPFLNWNNANAFLNMAAVLRSPAATAAQKARAKAVMAWVAYTIWDANHAPLDNYTGEGLGNANQVLAFIGFRVQHTLGVSFGNVHPDFSTPERLAIAGAAVDYLLGYVQLPPDGGAPRGSTWYHAAAMDPAIGVLFLWQKRGESIAPYLLRLAGWSQWMLDALTPPEPRFGNIRKQVSSGDGNTFGSPLPGVVASLLRTTNPTAAAAAQWGWASQNSATKKTFGAGTANPIIVIDQAATATSPTLGSRHYRGYWSVLRHGFGTPNETAAWFTNGEWYVDHRQSDSGQLSIYAHNAPLALDFNANLYNPQSSGSFAHNRAVMAGDAGHPWNADAPPLSAGSKGYVEAATNFAGFAKASRSETEFIGTAGVSTGNRWTRAVTMIVADPAHPLILVRDRFTSTNSGAGKVITWNMAAAGDVTGDWGTITPEVRHQLSAAGTPTQFPSAGPVTTFASIQRLRFTGTVWPQHATGGIDWDLYLAPVGLGAAFIGNWGHSAHATREMSEFQVANGQTFREIQHILRVQGTGDLTTLIAPFRKGEAPASRTVTQQACGLQVVQPSQTVCVSSRGYVASTSTTQTLATFEAAGVTAHGLTIGAGPAEVSVTGAAMTIALSGSAGPRSIVLSDGWSTPAGWTRTGNTISIAFDGTPSTYTASK